jgi:hypothetical protein
MKGRYIGENIRQLYDTLLYTESEQIPGLLLLVDFEKAFDSISWSFIDKTLTFFNFGNDMKRWVHAFYVGIQSCVAINGLYSAWFDICRGVRQGDPLSPYLYLLCAEILSKMICENECIKGIKIRGKDVLLSQFADDTALSLDGSRQSFVQAIEMLQRFAKMSGLNINYEKTQAIWMGNMKNSPIRYLRDMNFCWDPGIFKYLGIYFSTNYGEIVRLNFDGKLQEIKMMLKKWSKRNLTPFGKITILKTFVLSKFIYLFIILPDPNEDYLTTLNNECYTFLWDKKKKINKQEK